MLVREGIGEWMNGVRVLELVLVVVLVGKEKPGEIISRRRSETGVGSRRNGLPERPEKSEGVPERREFGGTLGCDGVERCEGRFEG